MEQEESEYSDEEVAGMLELYEDTLRDIEEGEIVKGRILHVGEAEIVVDVGFKSEGAIPISEFSDPSAVKVGDEIEVFLERLENQDGLVVLSKQRAHFMRVWDKIKDAYDTQAVVPGRLMRRIKGGLVVDLFGVEAFLPGSQVALRQVPNLDELIGEILEFRVIKLNKRRRNIVISRRVVLEEERAKKKAQVLAEIEKGEIREGMVKNITDFGAFVDLGGIDGLLHITDLCWGRVSHPSEMVAIGDTIKVKVLDFDKERERISLGLKQLTPYPWENVDERYVVASRVRGKVVSITDYGAFVELEKGIEGLIHVSEMSWTRHIRHPSKVVAVGDVIEAVVLRVDKDNEKISLGIKQIEPDPWLTIDEKYPVGTRLSGKVRNLTTFGAFVEIEEAIDGLVHISDMSWTKRIKHPSEVVKKGDNVDVIVLNVDKDNRRISLGLKQVQENPWEELVERYAPGVEVSGKISRLLDRGVVVDLDELEGFVPLSQLAIENLEKPALAFSEGDGLNLKVIRADPQNRRIVLSVRAYLSSRGDEEMEEFQAAHPVREEPPVEDAPAAAEETGSVEKPAAEEAAAEETESVEKPAAEEAAAEETGSVEKPAAEEASPVETVTGSPSDEQGEVEGEEKKPDGELS
ncbi:MAG: 30S ribosomal protein S1 [Candidatus Eisenbacteria sp.]|nr:30S ribosomal protein S1 [Candidatus Eisenbacteria bacterium]